MHGLQVLSTEALSATLANYSTKNIHCYAEAHPELQKNLRPLLAQRAED